MVGNKASPSGNTNNALSLDSSLCPGSFPLRVLRARGIGILNDPDPLLLPMIGGGGGGIDLAFRSPRIGDVDIDFREFGL